MLPTGLHNASRAWREAQQGVTDARGRQITPPLGVGQTLARLTGFQPTEAEERSRLTGLAYDTDQFYQGRTSALTQQLANARRAGDEGAMSSAMAAWMRLQQARREQGYTAQPLTDLLRGAQNTPHPGPGRSAV